LQEDIAKLVINMILKDDVLKVLLCLVRIDSFDMDRDLRAKYRVLRGIKTTDVGIDSYFSMNDAQLFFRELSKRHGVDLPHSQEDANKSMMNTTV